jgi:hypothetical protein
MEESQKKVGDLIGSWVRKIECIHKRSKQTQDPSL